jgi:hypothetical protein
LRFWKVLHDFVKMSAMQDRGYLHNSPSLEADQDAFYSGCMFCGYMSSLALLLRLRAM